MADGQNQSAGGEQKPVPSTVIGEVPPALRESAVVPPPVQPPPLQAVPIVPAAPIPYHLPPPIAGPGSSPPPWQGFAVPTAKVEIWRQALDFVDIHAKRAIERDLRTVEPTPGELPRLAAHGVKEPTIQRYLLWRRSWLLLLLPVATIAAVIQIPTLFSTDYSGFNWLGVLVFVSATLLQMFGFPVAAAVAAWKWDEHRFTRWALLAGWVASFLLPFMIALVPMGWFIALDESDPQLIAHQRLGAGIAGALIWSMTLLPALLAMMPGILRACIRIKSLLPESIVPGWILVLTAPVFSMILLIVFISINQVAGNLLLIFGALIFMGSPAVFMVKADLFIRPVTSARDRRQIETLQIIYPLVIACGVALLLLYIYTVQIVGHPLVGDTNEELPNHAFITTFDLIWGAMKFGVSYLAKSMFVTAVAIDLFMLVNLSVWRNEKMFAAMPEAENYDKTMKSFEAISDPPKHSEMKRSGGFEVVMPREG